MIRTIVVLLVTLITLPVIAVYYDAPLSVEQRDTLHFLVKLMLGVGLTCFVVSEITKNYSQVDKLWSIVPILYTWVVAVESGYNERLVLMASLVSIWGARLTFNFGRRGGYSWIPWQGEEDYRWAVLRQQPMFQSRLAWSAFNLFFISLYQQGLILLFTLPTIVSWQGADKPLGTLDYLAAALMLGFIVTETVADQQQYNFQQEKYRRKNAGEPLGEYSHGFCDKGLWSLVRHPNYASEQAIWLSFYLFSVAATGRWVNWSLAGGLLLVLLFLGSSDFSEKISAGKYPDYEGYQKRVPRFIPGLKWKS
jgi:steroid 5-alpha reductase family enzyme